MICAQNETGTAKSGKPNIKILATGGTIAGRGSSSTQTRGYTPGVIGIQTLIDAVPEIQQIANITGEQITNVASSAMTHDVWMNLAKRVNELLLRNEVDGIVITHGTSTLEETAYFLNLVVKSNKPVVLVGAMRPATALGADGPINLFNSVLLAGSKEAKGKGVLVALNDQINNARDVTKTNTTHVETFKAPDLGFLGYILSGKAYFYRESTRKHTFQSEFDLNTVVELPRVDILYGHVDQDRVIVDAVLAARTRGIVYACLGHGIPPISKQALMDAQKKGIVIVKSSRVGSGIVNRIPEDDETHFVAADTLSPQKARILLMLALTKTNDPLEVQRIFDEY